MQCVVPATIALASSNCRPRYETASKHPWCQVAAVVSASGEAGLTVAQQAAAAATSANAAAARVAETVAATSPLKMVGEALEG